MSLLSLRTYRTRIIRQCVLCGMLCAIHAGCSAPKRTFVSDQNEKTQDQPALASAPLKEQPAQVVPVAQRSEANSPHPSVWSKWMGALTPAKSKPTQRIPLPRTDRNAGEDRESFEPSAPEFSGF